MPARRRWSCGTDRAWTAIGSPTPKETLMTRLYTTLVDLSPARDADLLEGYQRYEATLEAILTAAQLEIYAESIRRTGMIRIVEDLTPAELADLPPDERA